MPGRGHRKSGLPDLRRFHCQSRVNPRLVSASPESIFQNRGYGFRARSLHSRPGMTTGHNRDNAARPYARNGIESRPRVFTIGNNNKLAEQRHPGEDWLWPLCRTALPRLPFSPFP